MRFEMARNYALRLFPVLVIALVLPSVSASSDETTIVNMPGNNLAWEKTPEGVAFARLVGDRFAEPYMAMVRLPGGLSSPPHVKTANMFGIIVSGSMVHSRLGQRISDDVILPPGSFYKIPKDLPHVSKCVSEEDCVTFLYQDGKFDFLPVAQ